MTLMQAVLRCFGSYASFSGRATRQEFWKFVLFLLIVHIVLVVVNSAIFGPTLEQEFRVTIDQARQQSQALNTKATYNGGWFGTVFFVATVVPWFAVAWRRMHDTGRAGWYCLAPIAAFAASFALMYLTSTEVPIDSTGLPEGVTLPETMRMPTSVWPFLLSWGLSFGSIILVIWWLARPSQPGPNLYGPNPIEVTP